MGNRKLKWTTDEEEALKAGVTKYGAGKWKNILADSHLKLKLAYRSNVDLKDKWRNLGVTVGQGSRANTMTPNGQTTANSVQPPITENPSSVTKDNINEMTPNGQAMAISVLPPKTQNSSSVATKDKINEKPSQSSKRAKNDPTYTGMILEALSSIKDRSGSGFSSILEFIEKKYEVPQKFKKTLSSKLRKLVMQGKLVKVHKRYKIKQASLAIKKPSLKRKVVRPKPRQKPTLCFSAKAVEDAAKTIAKHIAEAEYKSFIAAEAINESERISRMAEDSDAVITHLKEVFEQLEKTKQTSSRATEAISESERMAKDSDAAIMHLKKIFEQWEKTKQTALSTEAPNVSISRPSFT